MNSPKSKLSSSVREYVYIREDFKKRLKEGIESESTKIFNTYIPELKEALSLLIQIDTIIETYFIKQKDGNYLLEKYCKLVGEELALAASFINLTKQYKEIKKIEVNNENN